MAIKFQYCNKALQPPESSATKLCNPHKALQQSSNKALQPPDALGGKLNRETLVRESTACVESPT
eukprot:scaffold8123_cov66-Phaeocystis_antarctica.AAC.20